MGLCEFSKAEVGNRVHECKEMEYTLWLKHTKEYSLINAYNLAVMSILAYSDVNTDKKNPDRDVADFLKKMKAKQKLKVFKKDQQEVTTSVDQFVKEVYKDNQEGVQEKGQMIDKATSTEAFWFADTENIVLAVRGTQEINKDIILDSLLKGTGRAPDDAVIDLDGEQVSMTGIKGQVHRGFRTQAEAIIKKIDPFIGAARGKKLFITGHSLGAAVATILSAYLKGKGLDPLLYTYGSPRAGDEDFVKAYVDITHYRHVYQHDIVPIVPGRNLDAGIPELKLCATSGLIAGGGNPALTLVTLSGSLMLCTQNWSGPGYYHHGNLCQIVAAGDGSVMSPFESHGVVQDNIRKLLKNRDDALVDLETIKNAPIDTDDSGITSILEWYRHYMGVRKAEERIEDAKDALHALADDRKDDTSIPSTLLNGQVSDHFMSEGYLPFLKNEVKAQWQLYKQNNCKETSIDTDKSSVLHRRIDRAISRMEDEIKMHEYKKQAWSKIASRAKNSKEFFPILKFITAERKLIEKVQRDIVRLENMKKVKVGTYSLYSLKKSELELNKQLDKF